MKLSHLLLATAATACISTAAVAAEQKSPIFGASVPKLTSIDQNKATVGKGSSADYYGYYGYLYAYYSYYYAYYGLYGGGTDGTKSGNYYNAYYYSQLATYNLNYAYQYQYYGY